MNIEDTLKERDKDYGEFLTQASIIQGLKEIMRDTPNWNELSLDKREALDMIANKIGRILNGNPELHDHWYDIRGYALMIENTIRPP